jgi:hydroxymethylpyrimidine pyrophosphatase-like HAD family hydrolase
VLPQNAGKGKAMRYIQQQLGFGDTSTVAAGDANNDMPMLQQVRDS